MIVFRISKERYAKKLNASGFAARWNNDNEYVLYSSAHRSLAALELVAHRQAINLKSNYKIMLINLKVDVVKDIFSPNLKNLQDDFIAFKNISAHQKIGSKWYNENKFLAMKVPSVLIPQEFNFIINTKHKHFEKNVQLINVEDFIWDKRVL